MAAFPVSAVLGIGAGMAGASANISHSSFNSDYHGHSISLGETHGWTEHDRTGHMHASADIAATSTVQCADTLTASSSTAHAHCNTSFEESLLNSHRIGFHQGSHDL